MFFRAVLTPVEPSSDIQGGVLHFYEYGFQVWCPNNWSINDITWPDFPPRPVTVDNISSIHTFGRQSVPVVIAVYSNLSGRPASEWLIQKYGKEIAANPGNIQNALAKGYAGAEGVVSFLKRLEADTDAVEVGRISGGVLFYTGFFTVRGSPYLYAIELRLELNKAGKSDDATYADSFNKMLLSFTIDQNAVADQPFKENKAQD
jgi:hypothetical protein